MKHFEAVRNVYVEAFRSKLDHLTRLAARKACEPLPTVRTVAKHANRCKVCEPWRTIAKHCDPLRTVSVLKCSKSMNIILKRFEGTFELFEVFGTILKRFEAFSISVARQSCKACDPLRTVCESVTWPWPSPGPALVPPRTCRLPAPSGRPRTARDGAPASCK